MSLLLALTAGTSSALATELDEATVAALLPEVVARVEQIAGRRFVNVPPVVPEDLKDVQRRLEATVVDRARDAGVDDVEARAMAARASHAIGPGVLGVYERPGHRITLVTDSIQGLFSPALDERPPLVVGDTGGLPDALLLPLVRCVLAHELVHALQGEAGLFDRRSTPIAEWRAAIEGQATLIGDAVCATQGDLAPLGLVRLHLAWATAQNGQRSRGVVEYGAAPAWLAQQTGSDLSRSWEVLAAELPSRDQVSRVARSGCERSGEAMRAALDALAGRGPMRQVRGLEGMELFHFGTYGGYRAVGAASALCMRVGRGELGWSYGVGYLEFPDEATATGALTELRSGWREFARFVGPLQDEGAYNPLPLAHGGAYRVSSPGPARLGVRRVPIEGYAPRWWRIERVGTRLVLFLADGVVHPARLRRARARLAGPLPEGGPESTPPSVGPTPPANPDRGPPE